jgi:hypothetical protein
MIFLGGFSPGTGPQGRCLYNKIFLSFSGMIRSNALKQRSPLAKQDRQQKTALPGAQDGIRNAGQTRRIRAQTIRQKWGQSGTAIMVARSLPR